MDGIATIFVPLGTMVIILLIHSIVIGINVDDRALKGVIPLIIALLLCIGGTVFCYKVETKYNEEQTQIRTEAETLCKDNGFKLYLDGTEVDIDAVDFTQYAVPNINYEKKAVYLTLQKE